MVEDDLTQLDLEIAVVKLRDAKEEFEEAVKELKKIVEEGHWI